MILPTMFWELSSLNKNLVIRGNWSYARQYLILSEVHQPPDWIAKLSKWCLALQPEGGS